MASVLGSCVAPYFGGDGQSWLNLQTLYGNACPRLPMPIYRQTSGWSSGHRAPALPLPSLPLRSNSSWSDTDVTPGVWLAMRSARPIAGALQT